MDGRTAEWIHSVEVTIHILRRADKMLLFDGKQTFFDVILVIHCPEHSNMASSSKSLCCQLQAPCHFSVSGLVASSSASRSSVPSPTNTVSVSQVCVQFC